MSLKFCHEKNQMLFQIDISSISNIEALKNVVKLKFGLNYDAEYIGFVLHDANDNVDNSENKFYLSFEDMNACSEDKIINVIYSAQYHVINLLKAIEENTLAKIKALMLKIKPFFNDPSLIKVLYEKNAVSSLIKLVSLRSLTPFVQQSTWFLIEAIITQNEVNLDEKQKLFLRAKYFSDMSNPYLASLFKVICEQEEDILAIELPELQLFESISLDRTDMKSVLSHITIANYAIKQKYRNNETKIENLLVSKFFASAISIYDECIAWEGNQRELENTIIFADVLLVAQNLVYEHSFKRKKREMNIVQTKGKHRLVDAIREKLENILKSNNFSTKLLKEFESHNFMTNYLDNANYGLLYGLCLHHLTDLNTFILVLKYNDSAARSDKQFPIFEFVAHSIDMMDKIFAMLDTDESIYNGVFKPLFFEKNPLHEFFVLVFDTMFKNWKEMSGSTDMTQNILNFTEYQFQEIIKASTCRKQNFFREYKTYIPSYSSKIHTWLKLDIKSIIKQPIDMPKALLHELQKNFKKLIIAKIADSRIRYMQDVGITVERVHKGKDKQHITFSLDQYYNFTVTHLHDDNNKAGDRKQVIKTSQFKAIRTKDNLPMNIHGEINSKIDESVLKKVDRSCLFLVFENNIFLIRPLNAKAKEIGIMDDCLTHLSGSMMKSVQFNEEFVKLMHLMTKVQLFELDAKTLSNLKEAPKMPIFPKDLVE